MSYAGGAPLDVPLTSASWSSQLIPPPPRARLQRQHRVQEQIRSPEHRRDVRVVVQAEELGPSVYGRLLTYSA